MDMEEDDSMEIDETIPAAPIIERRSDEFSPNNSLTDQKCTQKSVNTDVVMSESATSPTAEKQKTQLQELENPPDIELNKHKQQKSGEKQVDVVILDDDDDDEDEPMKTVEGGTR